MYMYMYIVRVHVPYKPSPHTKGSELMVAAALPSHEIYYC